MARRALCQLALCRRWTLRTTISASGSATRPSPGPSAPTPPLTTLPSTRADQRVPVSSQAPHHLSHSHHFTPPQVCAYILYEWAIVCTYPGQLYICMDGLLYMCPVWMACYTCVLCGWPAIHVSCVDGLLYMCPVWMACYTCVLCGWPAIHVSCVDGLLYNVSCMDGLLYNVSCVDGLLYICPVWMACYTMCPIWMACYCGVLYGWPAIHLSCMDGLLYTCPAGMACSAYDLTWSSISWMPSRVHT